MPRVNTNQIPNNNYLSIVGSSLPAGSFNASSNVVIGVIPVDANTFTVGDVVLLEAVVTKSGSSGGYSWNVVWGKSADLPDIINDVPIFDSLTYSTTATYSNCYKYMVIAGTAGSPVEGDVLGTAVYDTQIQIDTYFVDNLLDNWITVSDNNGLSIDWDYATFFSDSGYSGGGYFKVIGRVQNSSDRIRLEWIRVSGYASGSFNVPTPEVLNSFYSVRQLSGYSGPAIRVRRSSGGEQDIGFSSGVLDITSLLSFVGSGDGFVTTWYEQTGFGNDLSVSTVLAQPQIVFSGSVNTSGGFPCIYFDGVEDRLVENNGVSPFYNFSTGGRFSAFCVFETKNFSNPIQTFLHVDRVVPRFSQIARISGTTMQSIAFNTIGSAFTDNATTIVENRRYLSSTIRRQTNIEIYVDGVSNGSTATTGTPASKSTQLEVGCRVFPSSEAFIGNLYEVAIYDRDCATASRVTIENQISNYYGI